MTIPNSIVDFDIHFQETIEGSGGAQMPAKTEHQNGKGKPRSGRGDQVARYHIVTSA